MKKLLSVSKPLRYTGGEYGMIKKDPKGRLKFCLAFPDVYEIGMSHVGFRILYTALNSSDEIACERFFAPWPDAWEKLGRDVLVSLENRIHISEFDVFGFSMQYELAYTTALRILKMGGIPLKSRDRKDGDPIIIAGGGCILNPAPLSAFIDVFFLGEMDVALTEAMLQVHHMKKENKSRMEILEMLNSYPFTYVPLIEPSKKAVREIYKDFASQGISQTPLVPVMPAIQDRVAIEIARGCTNGCRFCQAGMIYRPVREKSVANLCNAALSLTAETGYQEVSLLSLDTGDYSDIDCLLDELGSEMADKNIALSLPSLRAETVNPGLLDKIGGIRKSGFTIAPEAGSQRLRDVINKNLTEDDIINAAIYAKNGGFNGVKLYFMCGLPYETDEDILGIAQLASKIKSAVRGGRGFDITVSISNFVPKPHTPFERFAQISASEMFRKHMLLKDALKKDNIKFRYHDSDTSVIEAAIARGSEEWEEIFVDAVEKGFYLDAWSEFFSVHKWRELFADNNKSFEDFACISYGDEDILPWDMVDCGVDKAWLLKERDRAKEALTTSDCRHGDCSVCGVCKKGIKNVKAATSYIEKKQQIPDKEKFYAKYELIFEKKGISSFMSALDLSRIFAHMFLSCGVDLKFTEGFHPQPRLVIQAPMPVGVEGTNEILLFEASLGYENVETLTVHLNTKAPNGLIIKGIQLKAWPKNMSEYEMVLEFDQESFNFICNSIKTGTANYEKTGKNGKVKIVDLNEYLIDVYEENCQLKVKVTSAGGFHMPEFFRKSGYGAIPSISRTEVVLAGAS